MMRKISFTLLGAIVGCLLLFGAVYLSGVVMQEMGMRLYDSEADQQRNFNIVMSAAAAFSVFGGWLGYRIASRVGPP